jgi:hypothetical protein
MTHVSSPIGVVPRRTSPVLKLSWNSVENRAKISTNSQSMLRFGQPWFAWSPPEWLVAISLYQEAGRFGLRPLARQESG